MVRGLVRKAKRLTPCYKRKMTKTHQAFTSGVFAVDKRAKSAVKGFHRRAPNAMKMPCMSDMLFTTSL